MQRSYRKSATAAVTATALLALTSLAQASDKTWGLDTPVFGPTAAAFAISEKCPTNLSQDQKLVLRSHLERLIGIMVLADAPFAISLLGLLEEYRSKYAEPKNCTERSLTWAGKMVVAIRAKGADARFWQHVRERK